MPIVPKFVIFDLDGTLLDNQEIVIDAYQTGLQEFGFAKKNRDFIASLFGKSTHDTAIDLGVPKDKIHLIDNYFWDYFGKYARSDEKPRIMPGVEELLDFLNKLNISMGVITSNLAEYAKMMLGKARLLHHFIIVIGAEDVRNTKPSIEPIKVLFDRLEYDFDPLVDNSKNIWFVGDTLSDILCAKKANLLSIDIQQGTNENYSIPNPDIRVDSMQELLDKLKLQWF